MIFSLLCLIVSTLLASSRLHKLSYTLAEIRRLIYTTNAIEGYHRRLRKVIKTKGSFPTPEAVRKLLYLANDAITQKWTAPLRNWTRILNQLAIRIEERMPLP